MARYINADNIKYKHVPQSCLAVTKDEIDNMTTEDVRPNFRVKWIEKAEDYYKAIIEDGGEIDENTDYFTDDIACPICLSKFSTIDNETERFKFCPNCGVDMR